MTTVTCTALELAHRLPGSNRRPDGHGRYRLRGWCHGKGESRTSKALVIWDRSDGRGIGAKCWAGCAEEDALAVLSALTGWRLRWDNLPVRTQPVVQSPAPSPVSPDELAAAAAERALTVLERCSLGSHPYLAAKGFPDYQVLIAEDMTLAPLRSQLEQTTVWQACFRDELTGADVLSGGRYRHKPLGDLLVVPMRHYQSGQVASLQLIGADGVKHFLRGGRAGGAVYRIGSGAVVWWCEGLATGLSIAEALALLYRRDSVTVAFSADNLGSVATGGLVIADHDLYHCGNSVCQLAFDYMVGGRQVIEVVVCPACGSRHVSPPAGLRYALQTGLRYWLPPDTGQDANDYALRYGHRALADRLRETLLG